MLRLGWMSTARGEGSFALLRFVCEQIQAGSLDARIEVVISNRVRGESAQTDRFFDFAEALGLPLVCESSAQLRQSVPAGVDWRTRLDRLLVSRIQEYEIDVIFMAGYMLIASDFLCAAYPLLNLHPALPGGPTGTWREVMAELARTGADRTGAMIHIVTPELDRGPVLSFFSFSLQGEPFAALRAAGELDSLAGAIRDHELRREFPLILATLRSLASGEIMIRDGRPYDTAGSLLSNGKDLSAEVDRFLHQA